MRKRGRYLFLLNTIPVFQIYLEPTASIATSGRNFENDKYLNNALDSDVEMQDNGRMAVTNNASDKGKFKKFLHFEMLK